MPKLSKLSVTKKLLSSFDISNIDLEIILYQAGYLTIDKMEINEDEDIIYHLRLPNKEVRSSLSQFIITSLYKDKTFTRSDISKALRNSNLEDLETSLKVVFASLPYTNFTNNNIEIYEGFYASVIYTYLQSSGIKIISPSTN